MSFSSSSLIWSSLLCSSWTKCPLSSFSSITRPTSWLRVSLCASGGQSGLLSTSSGFWPHRDTALLRAPVSTSSSWSTVRLLTSLSAWVSTGMMCPRTPSPNSSSMACIAWLASWPIPMPEPGAWSTSRKACGPGLTSWRLLKASLALLLIPSDDPRISGVSISVTSLPSNTVICLVQFKRWPFGAFVSLLPNKVLSKVVRPPPAGPMRISLKPGLLLGLPKSPSLDDPIEGICFFR